MDSFIPDARAPADTLSRVGHRRSPPRAIDSARGPPAEVARLRSAAFDADDVEGSRERIGADVRDLVAAASASRA